MCYLIQTIYIARLQDISNKKNDASAEEWSFEALIQDGCSIPGQKMTDLEFGDSGMVDLLVCWALEGHNQFALACVAKTSAMQTLKRRTTTTKWKFCYYDVFFSYPLYFDLFLCVMDG